MHACRLLGTGIGNKPGTFTYTTASALAAALVDPPSFTVANATFTGAPQAAAIIDLSNSDVYLAPTFPLGVVLSTGNASLAADGALHG